MNPFQRIPEKVRFVIYVLYVIAGPVLIYLNAKGITGEEEYTLYIGVGVALGITAASNTNIAKKIQ